MMATLVRFVGILILAGDLVLGPVRGTYYSLFQKEISKIPMLPLVYLIKIIESLDTIFRLQNIKVS